jgi:hypothetical protein
MEHFTTKLTQQLLVSDAAAAAAAAVCSGGDGDGDLMVVAWSRDRRGELYFR